MPSFVNKITTSLLIIYDSLVSSFLLLIARLLPKLEVKPVDLTNQTALITGSNSGIGFSLAQSLASQNATIYLACRNTTKGEAAAKEILTANPKINPQNIHVLELDTSSLASVRAFAKTWEKSATTTTTSNQPPKIDILIHNAGISSTPSDQRTTSEGLGTIYATNFAGSFLLTSLLERHLSPSARVILTSSTGQYVSSPNRLFTLPRLAPKPEDSIPDSALYADTKFMQVAFASFLQARFDKEARLSNDGRRKIAAAFTPGYTFTPIFSKTTSLPALADPFFWLLKACTALCVPVDQGAATGLWLATTAEREVVDEGRGGGFWDRMVRRRTAVEGLDGGVLERMWGVWEGDTGARWA